MWKKIAILNGSLFCLFLMITVYTIAAGKTNIKIKKPTPDTMSSIHSHVPIREGTSTDDRIVQIADKGDKLVTRKKLESWYNVSNEKIAGFIFRPMTRVNQTKNKEELQDKTIVIDAGHGGTDTGATGASGVREKDLTLKTAKRLQDTLDSLGVKVIMTRDKDEYVSLEDRVHIADRVDPDSFISIHYNSVPEIPDASGISTFYFEEQNKKLANALQNEIIDETDAGDRETNVADFRVIRQNQTPAALIELGFISNTEEEQLLQTHSYQEKLIEGIAEGLVSFFAGKEH